MGGLYALVLLLCLYNRLSSQRDEPDHNGEWHCWKDDNHHSKQWLQRIHLQNIGVQDQKDGSVRIVCVNVYVCVYGGGVYACLYCDG